MEKDGTFIRQGKMQSPLTGMDDLLAAVASIGEEFGRYTAAGIYGIQAVLDLERFAIGGGISARPEVTEKIRQCVDRQFERIPFTPFGKPEIVTCRYGNDANLIGALSFHLEREGR